MSLSVLHGVPAVGEVPVPSAPSLADVYQPFAADVATRGSDDERLLALLDAVALHTPDASSLTAELPSVAELSARIDALADETAAGTFEGAIARQVRAHLRRTAVIARTVARAFDVAPDEAHLLGLVHDVGKLVVCDAVRRLRVAARRERWGEVRIGDACLRDTLARLHEPLGAVTLVRWGLDPRAALAVATHHRRGHAAGGPAALAGGPLAETIFLAERLDLARSRGRAVTVRRWIAEGGLTASPHKIAAVVDRVMEQCTAW